MWTVQLEVEGQLGSPEAKGLFDCPPDLLGLGGGHCHQGETLALIVIFQEVDHRPLASQSCPFRGVAETFLALESDPQRPLAAVLRQLAVVAEFHQKPFPGSKLNDWPPFQDLILDSVARFAGRGPAQVCTAARARRRRKTCLGIAKSGRQIRRMVIRA